MDSVIKTCACLYVVLVQISGASFISKLWTMKARLPSVDYRLGRVTVCYEVQVKEDKSGFDLNTALQA